MSERTPTGAGAAIAAGLPGLPAGSRSIAGVLVAAAAIVLAAVLGYLHFKTQGVDLRRHSAVLALLRELKEIDARWDVDVLRTRAELSPAPAPAVDYSSRIARIRSQLTAASQEIDRPVHTRGVNDLTGAFTQKAELVDKFRKANAASKQALAQVFAADTEIAGLVRGSWQEVKEKERLVALEAAVAQLLAEAQKYYFGAGDAQKSGVETTASDVRESTAQLPAALREGIARLDGNVQQLLGAKPIEEELFTRLSFMTAGPRVDSMTNAFSGEIETLLGERELYRVYLSAFSGALLVLVGCLASRLLASYRRLDLASEELERRGAERTRELAEALRQLKEAEAQLIRAEKLSCLGQMVAGFNLNEGLDSTLLLAKHELKHVTVQKRYGDIPPITCSASQVNQVVLNLINNAAQAVEPGQGTLTLTTRREDDAHVAVEIEDNGKGIPPDVLPRIFDPFFTTKDVGKGAGLGLSICHKIVEQHGGRITVDSAVGIGTKFKLVLPVTPPATGELAA